MSETVIGCTNITNVMIKRATQRIHDEFDPQIRELRKELIAMKKAANEQRQDSRGGTNSLQVVLQRRIGQEFEAIRQELDVQADHLGNVVSGMMEEIDYLKKKIDALGERKDPVPQRVPDTRLQVVAQSEQEKDNMKKFARRLAAEIAEIAERVAMLEAKYEDYVSKLPRSRREVIEMMENSG